MSSFFLKRALWANALFSMLSGALLLFMPHALGDLMGIRSVLLLQVLGVGLLGFALLVGLLASRKHPNTFAAMLVSIADILWVVGTPVVILFASGILTTTGVLILIGVAAMVLLFAIIQLMGIEQVYRVHPESGDEHQLCIDIATNAPADAIWAVIGDMGRINEFSSGLAAAELLANADPGVGAVRHCTSTDGNAWSEQCTLFDPAAHELAVVFLTDEPDFPYPFDAMRGGWSVRPEGIGSTVSIWFVTTPQRKWMSPFILAYMSRNLVSSGGFAATVGNMAAEANGEMVQIETPQTRGLTAKLAAC